MNPVKIHTSISSDFHVRRKLDQCKNHISENPYVTSGKMMEHDHSWHGPYGRCYCEREWRLGTDGFYPAIKNNARDDGKSRDPLFIQGKPVVD